MNVDRLDSQRPVARRQRKVFRDALGQLGNSGANGRATDQPQPQAGVGQFRPRLVSDTFGLCTNLTDQLGFKLRFVCNTAHVDLMRPGERPSCPNCESEIQRLIDKAEELGCDNID